MPATTQRSFPERGSAGSADPRRGDAPGKGARGRSPDRSSRPRWVADPNGDRGRPIRPQLGLTWPLWVLLAASLAVPLLLLAAAAWQNYRLVQAQAEERILIEANEMHQHALDAFRTYTLALDWIDDRIRGLDWDRIENDPELHRFLSDLE